MMNKDVEEDALVGCTWMMMMMLMNEEDDDDDGVDDVDDIYIMMKCVFVCHKKSSLPTSELSAGGAM